MGLTLRHIEVIRAVLRAGTLTGAARQLTVSQPGLSRTLRNAENRLGILLFERRSGRLHPTPEALALYPDIENAYAEIEAIQRAATDLKHVRGGRLSIVCNPSVAATMVAEAIGQLAKSAPGVRVSLQTALNYEVIEQVRARAADMGFAWDVPKHPAVTATEIGQSRLVCLMPEGHPLAELKVIDARALHELPLISFSTTLPIGAALESAFAESGATRRIGVEVGQTYVAAALVKAGAGIGVVDDLAIGEMRHGLVVKPFVPERVVRLFAVTRPERLSLVAQAFLDSVTKIATERSAGANQAESAAKKRSRRKATAAPSAKPAARTAR